MQFVERMAWIPRFNVNYHLGVDGISMPLILLNSLMTVMVVIAHWEVITDKVGQYLAAFLIMSGLINGVFAALIASLVFATFNTILSAIFSVGSDESYYGMLVAQIVKPQARLLATARGFTVIEVDYEELRGRRVEDLRLF